MNRYYLQNIIICPNIKSSYRTSNLNLNIIYNKKKQLKKIIVKDGIINLHFNVNELFCSLCSTNECFHINYIYNFHFKIDHNLVHLLYCNDFNYSLIDFDINKFHDYCYKYINDNECCFCLDKLNTTYYLWCCIRCKYLIHNKCISEWQKKNNECPLCKQTIKY